MMKKNYNEILYKNETIELENIILRKYRADDAEDIFEYASDVETVKHLTWSGVQSVEEARAGIYDYYWSKPGIYAIEFRENAKCIGCIDLRIKVENEKASLGYVLNRKYWGRGLMSGALRAVLELCFEKLELNRVEAGHFVGNEASGRVMAKCGMVQEGISKQSSKVRGVFRDEVHYAITREQWVALK